MKRVISLLLVVSMLFSFAITSFASGAEDDVLRFRKNGTFKILVLADVQDVYPIEEGMISFINEALDYAKPDLVVFDGDNIVTEDVRAYEQLLTPLAERDVPFTFVFGNHDVERENFTAEQQLAEYQKYDGCLAYDADPALHGCANHNLLIYSSKGNDIAFNLWMFDSNDYLDGIKGTGYDYVHKDQLDWYKRKSDKLKKENDADRFFNEELERLQTDYIDYYLMHMLTDTDTWERLKALGIEDWLAEKKRSGAIRQVGFSYHGNADMFCRLIDAYDWDFCQIQYNYMDEHTQAGRTGLNYAHEKGVKVESVPGPTAVLTALAISGMPSGRFCFEGFLSTNKNERLERLNEIKNDTRTTIFYEAPHKLKQTLVDMFSAFGNREKTIEAVDRIRKNLKF